MAIFELTTWALSGNDRVVTEAVEFIRNNQVVTAKPGGFYTFDMRTAPGTLLLPPTKEVPGAFVYAYIVVASADGPAIIRATGRDRVDGRGSDGKYGGAKVEYKIESGKGWSFALRSDGDGFWVIV